MSNSRGNTARTRSQKHQNKTVFKNNLHDTSHKTKFINSLDINGVCNRCKEIIEWKIKYKKYKPLTAPRKCVNCDQKTVKHAYHVMCQSCAKSKHACAKCCNNAEVIATAENQENLNEDLQVILKALPERKRRTLLRYINKNQDEIQKLNSEVSESEVAKKLEELKLSLCSRTGDDDLALSDSDSCDNDSD